MTKNLTKWVAISLIGLVAASCASEDEPSIETINNDETQSTLVNSESIDTTTTISPSAAASSPIPLALSHLANGDSGITPHFNFVNYTVHGYTSLFTEANRKELISSELSKLTGLPRQIYILNYTTVYYKLTIAGLKEDKALIRYVDSPKCGIKPGAATYTRGYVLSDEGENSDNVIFSTRIVHIISDLSGRSYDKYFPCKPEQLEWNYKVASE